MSKTAKLAKKRRLSVVLVVFVLLVAVASFSAYSTRRDVPQSLRYSEQGTTAVAQEGVRPKGIEASVNSQGKAKIVISAGKSESRVSRHISVGESGVVLKNGRIDLDVIVAVGDLVTQDQNPVIAVTIEDDLESGKYPVTVNLIERNGLTKKVNHQEVFSGELIVN